MLQLIRQPASQLLFRGSQRHRHHLQCHTQQLIVRFASVKKRPVPLGRPRRKPQRRNKVTREKEPSEGAEPPPPPHPAGEVFEPSRRQLYVVAIHQGIPFVGFGIMDNAILLLAGEAIDIYLGVTLGISTMCAAAIGNIVSDLCGVAFGTVIEDALLGWSKKVEKITRGRVKLPPMPKLTYEQRNLRSVRLSGQFGCAMGLTIGCIVGMFPLLFFPESERKKEAEGGDHSNSHESSANDQKEQLKLKAEIRQWQQKHAEVVDQLKVLEREKNDGLWDRGY
ncbi:hypothetical protein ACHAWF_005073 [Thalassiosira exigua]